LKAVHHIVASSAETMGAFNTGSDRINLHRLTKHDRGSLPMGEEDSLVPSAPLKTLTRESRPTEMTRASEEPTPADRDEWVMLDKSRGITQDQCRIWYRIEAFRSTRTVQTEL